jgi:hypothetical protein
MSQVVFSLSVLTERCLQDEGDVLAELFCNLKVRARPMRRVRTRAPCGPARRGHDAAALRACTLLFVPNACMPVAAFLRRVMAESVDLIIVLRCTRKQQHPTCAPSTSQIQGLMDQDATCRGIAHGGAEGGGDDGNAEDGGDAEGGGGGGGESADVPQHGGAAAAAAAGKAHQRRSSTAALAGAEGTPGVASKPGKGLVVFSTNGRKPPGGGGSTRGKGGGGSSKGSSARGGRSGRGGSAPRGRGGRSGAKGGGKRRRRSSRSVSDDEDSGEDAGAALCSDDEEYEPAKQLF